MRITMYGGPYDGEEYAVDTIPRYICVTLPIKPVKEVLEEDRVPMSYAEVPIFRNHKFNYIANWYARREVE